MGLDSTALPLSEKPSLSDSKSLISTRPRASEIEPSSGPSCCGGGRGVPPVCGCTRHVSSIPVTRSPGTPKSIRVGSYASESRHETLCTGKEVRDRVQSVLNIPSTESRWVVSFPSNLACPGESIYRISRPVSISSGGSSQMGLWGSSCTACALCAYCTRRGWDTHPSNTVGGDRIISSESISEE